MSVESYMREQGMINIYREMEKIRIKENEEALKNGCQCEPSHSGGQDEDVESITTDDIDDVFDDQWWYFSFNMCLDVI